MMYRFVTSVVHNSTSRGFIRKRRHERPRHVVYLNELHQHIRDLHDLSYWRKELARYVFFYFGWTCSLELWNSLPRIPNTHLFKRSVFHRKNDGKFYFFVEGSCQHQFDVVNQGWRLSSVDPRPPNLHLGSSEQWCLFGGRGIFTELSLCYSIV